MYRFPIWLASGLLLMVGCNRTPSQGEASREATQRGNTDVAFVRYVSAMHAHSDTALYFGETQLFRSANASKPTDYTQVPAERREFVLRHAGRPDVGAIEKNSE